MEVSSQLHISAFLSLEKEIHWMGRWKGPSARLVATAKKYFCPHCEKIYIHIHTYCQ
jgi:hypothetical protein